MAANKTIPTKVNVDDFIGALASPIRQKDAETLLALFDRTVAMRPCMWGDSMIGYGFYHYKYESGREGDYFLTGFSPRKSATSIYIMPGFKQYADHLSRLGPYKHSVSCLYLTRLDRIDLGVLEEIVVDSVRRMKDMYEWRGDPFQIS